MASRPRHEALRGLVTDLLRDGFGARFSELEHERYLVDNSGRIDVAWGATVIELKSDLRREERDVVARMPDYLADAARSSGPGRTTVGLATDGATLIAYRLDRGALSQIGRYEVDVQHPDRLLSWLEPLLSPVPEAMPTPIAVALAFGRYSLAFGRAHGELQRLWAEVGANPEVRLKRDLWDGLLRQVYGDDVGSDALFLQHTYLTILVKAIAARVLDLEIDDPAEMLSGRLLANEGIVGAVEADFFDWPLLAAGGDELVRTLAAETRRFRLRDVEVDVLKSLYESLIDPDERHDLGEYYTPDWLAARVVSAAISRPLEQRVLDPSCGSGTFLFHALRRLIATGREEGLPPAEIVAACADRVFGIDVHPVAVALARVTWLLALGDLVQDRPPVLTVPVYMGDSMQWNLRPLGTSAEVLVDVPPNDPPLRIPAGLASDLGLFEQALDELNRGLNTLAEPEAVRDAIARAGAMAEDAAMLGRTFAQLKQLFLDGRNHIWTFVLRNLLRPVWLSHPDHRADVLIGNPPWIVYRHLSAEMKDRLREALQSYGLWVGGPLATHQDMFALFWARGAERYLSEGGRLALVLPYAALNAPVFAGMRNGGLQRVKVAVTGAWGLERVWPIFGAQSGSSTTSTCVLFGERDSDAPLPAEFDRWVGILKRRDATEPEAAEALQHINAAWPRPRTLIAASPYRARFRQGATLTPRRFFIVETANTGRLGSRRDAPRVRGRIGNLDKKPWTDVTPPEGPIERQFLRRIALGESVAPYRILDLVTGVVPMEDGTILTAASADGRGYRGLSGWLRDAEGKWNEHSNKDGKGHARMSLAERLDAMGMLRAQSSRTSIRVLYTKAGTRLSACWIKEDDVIIDHKAYWSAAHSLEEAAYITAILNTKVVLDRVKDLQPVGQRDPRDFDNLVWTLPIPEYDPTEALHVDLAAAALHAHAVAARVTLPDEAYFTTKRGLIREALVADGVAETIERLVDALLPL
ncbi:class I SAM-dependent methyltransferase [Affinirhizobium pseudoryzae]|uniref:class I SAM-dependent methyltransferase n=1 Tax=Allorhizobium pseudoryzae TaxID=379684 RepID=UPI0013EDC4AA|nr:class I SAM-dependent methyltransferase [Allorhizobium pseudoryzae]